MAFRESLETEKIIQETLSVENSKRKQIEATATPQNSARVGQIHKQYPALPTGVKLAMAKAGFTDDQIEKIYGPASVAVQRQSVQEKPKKSWFERNVEDKLKTASRYSFAALNFPLDFVQTGLAQIFDSDDSVAGWFIASDLGTMIANDTESGDGWFMGGKARQLQAERAKRVRGTVGGHAWTVGRGLASTVFKPDTMGFNVMSGAFDAAVALGIPTLPGAKPVKTALQSAEEAGKGGVAVKGAVEVMQRVGRGSAKITRTKLEAEQIEDIRKGVLVGDSVNYKEANRWFGTAQARRVVERTAQTNNFAEVWNLWGRKIDPELAMKMADETNPDAIRNLLLDKLGQSEGLTSTKNFRGGDRTYISIARRDKFLNTLPLGRVSRAYANMPQRSFNLAKVESPIDQVRHLNTIESMMKLSLVEPETQTAMLNKAAKLMVSKEPVGIKNYMDEFDVVMRRAATGAKVKNTITTKVSSLVDPRRPEGKLFRVGQRVKLSDDSYGYVKTLDDNGNAIVDLVDERIHGDVIDAVFDRHKKFIEDSKDLGGIDDAGRPEDYGFYKKVFGDVDPNANEITFASSGLTSELMTQDYFIPDVRQIRRLTATKPLNWVIAKQGKLGDPNLERLAQAGDLRLPFAALTYLQEEIWRPIITLTTGNHVRNTLDSQMAIAMSHRDVSSIFRHPFNYLAILRKELQTTDIFGRPLDADVVANQISEAQKARKFVITEALNSRYKDPVEKHRVMERLGIFRQVTRGKDDVASVVSGHANELGKLNANWATRALAGGMTREEVFKLIKSGDEEAVEWYETMRKLYEGGRETFNRTAPIGEQWGRSRIDLANDNNLELLIDEQADRLMRATGDGDQELLDIVAAKGGLSTREVTVDTKSILSGEASVGSRVEYRTKSGRIAMGEVVDTGLVPGETVIRPYAFIQGDATPDLRKILASDAVFKNPKMPRVVVEEISNPNTPAMNKIRRSMDRIVDSFHAKLYNEPIGKLERSPIFSELYYNWVDELADSLDKASIDKIIGDIKNSAADYVGGARKPERLVGEKTWNKLLDLQSGKRKSYGTITAEELNAFASGRAIDDIQKMFYNAVERSNFVDAMRIISPFAAQWGEFIGRAGRVAFTPTNLGPLRYLPDVNVMRKTQLLVSGATEADPDNNGRGFVYKDPATGQMLFTIPFSGAVTKLFTGVESPINARLKGVAMGFDTQPGVGPVATFALSKYLPDKPGTDVVRDFLLPYGPKTDPLATFTPGWLNKIVDGMSGNEGNAMFMNVYTETMQALAVSGKYDPSNLDDRERLMNDARKKARILFALRGLSQFTGPASGTFDQTIKVATAKGEMDVYASQLSSVFREMQENDYDTAVLSFIEAFGEDAFVYMGNKTKALYGGLDASKKFGDFERDNKSLFTQFKEVAGYFGPIDTEFDFTVYTRQLESGMRKPLTPEETLDAAEVTIAMAFYRSMRDKFPKSMDSEQREYMSQYREALQKRFPGYAKMQFDPNKLPRQLDQLFTAANSGKLDGNPVAEGVKFYSQMREQVLAQAEARGYTTLASDDVEDLRVYLSEYADAITAKYPEFARVYDRLLSQEVED